LNHSPGARRRTVLATIATAVVAGLVPIAPASADMPADLYPIRPGTQAWAEFDTYDEMVRATQLPAGVPEAMSTDDLAASALDYPLLLDPLYHDNIQLGMDSVVANSNVLTELIRRPGAGGALLKRYADIQIRLPDSVAPLDAGDHTFEVWKVESLLAQPQVLGGMSRDQLEEILRIGRDKYAAKQANPQTYSRSGLEPTTVLLGRALALREGWDWTRVPLLRDATAPSSAAIDEIVPTLDRHFTEPGVAHPITAGIAIMDRNTIVRTPLGTAVGVVEISDEFTDAEIKSLNARVQRQWPKAKRETNASRRYNCHSYAWYSQATNNKIWMNTPGDDTYWRDRSYVWTTGTNAGLRWSWPESTDHTAIGTGSGWVRGKWGKAGRMFHWYNYGPYEHPELINKYREN